MTVVGNRKLQAEHFQNISDLDGDSDDMCNRDSCWDLEAGCMPCWVFRPGSKHSGRCRTCDHLPECHMDQEKGKKAEAEFFAEFGLGGSK